MLVDLCNGHRTVVVVVEIGGYRTVRSSLLPPSLLLSMLIIPVIMWTLYNNNDRLTAFDPGQPG